MNNYNLLIFSKRHQLFLFLVFWLCYFSIHIISTSFFSTEIFRAEIILHSLLYSIGGMLFSFWGYKSVLAFRATILSSIYFLLLSVLSVYLITILWMVFHHLSWWIISGNEAFALRISIYPVKALLYSIIILAAIMLLLLTEKKSLTIANSNEKDSLDLRHVQGNGRKGSDYEDTILLPVNNKILNIRIDSIKVIQANDYYSNLISQKIDKPVLNNYSLKKWEDILPRKHFIRIHRSSIINLNYVENIEKMNNNTYKVKIKDISETISMSRRYAKSIFEKFQF